ncbi:hypothetical protein MHYP_G00129960 [Metynnis hypsauchen]
MATPAQLSTAEQPVVNPTPPPLQESAVHSLNLIPGACGVQTTIAGGTVAQWAPLPHSEKGLGSTPRPGDHVLPGPSPTPEKQPHTMIPPPPNFTLGTVQSVIESW